MAEEYELEKHSLEEGPKAIMQKIDDFDQSIRKIENRINEEKENHRIAKQEYAILKQKFSEFNEENKEVIQQNEELLAKNRYVESKLNKITNFYQKDRETVEDLSDKLNEANNKYKSLYQSNKEYQDKLSSANSIIKESLENEKALLLELSKRIEELDKYKKDFNEACIKYRAITNAHAKAKNYLIWIEDRYNALKKSKLGRIQIKYWTLINKRRGTKWTKNI